MALTDVTDGSRIVQWGSGAIKVVLAAACKPGDLLTEAGALADGNATTPAPAAYVAGEKGASADTITAYRRAILSGLSGATLGNVVYLSDTAGSYTATPSTTQRQRVGFALNATDIFVEPERSLERFAVQSGVIDATYDTDRYFFVARERVRVVSIEVVASAIEATGAATTVQVQKIVTTDGIGNAAQKNLLAAALNLKTGLVANNVLSPSLTATVADLVMDKGNSLALDFTNALAEFAGAITVWLEPA